MYNLLFLSFLPPPVASVQFVNATYEAFEVEGSVTICLEKNAETAGSFVVAVQPFESIVVPDDAFRARGVCVTMCFCVSSVCVWGGGQNSLLGCETDSLWMQLEKWY